jgi:hypothetical protein
MKIPREIRLDIEDKVGNALCAISLLSAYDPNRDKYYKSINIILKTLIEYGIIGDRPLFEIQ